MRQRPSGRGPKLSHSCSAGFPPLCRFIYAAAISSRPLKHARALAEQIDVSFQQRFTKEGCRMKIEKYLLLALIVFFLIIIGLSMQKMAH
jgi:hypothetical protein